MIRKEVACCWKLWELGLGIVMIVVRSFREITALYAAYDIDCEYMTLENASP
jgi:hypothetical protein